MPPGTVAACRVPVAKYLPRGGFKSAIRAAKREGATEGCTPQEIPLRGRDRFDCDNRSAKCTAWCLLKVRRKPPTGCRRCHSQLPVSPRHHSGRRPSTNNETSH